MFLPDRAVCLRGSLWLRGFPNHTVTDSVAGTQWLVGGVAAVPCAMIAAAMVLSHALWLRSDVCSCVQIHPCRVCCGGVCVGGRVGCWAGALVVRLGVGVGVWRMQGEAVRFALRAWCQLPPCVAGMLAAALVVLLLRLLMWFQVTFCACTIPLPCVHLSALTSHGHSTGSNSSSRGLGLCPPETCFAALILPRGPGVATAATRNPHSFDECFCVLLSALNSAVA